LIVIASSLRSKVDEKEGVAVSTVSGVLCIQVGKWPEASLLVTRATKREIEAHEEKLRQEQFDSIDVRHHISNCPQLLIGNAVTMRDSIVCAPPMLDSYT
jgi:hypothetical protein